MRRPASVRATHDTTATKHATGHRSCSRTNDGASGPRQCSRYVASAAVASEKPQRVFQIHVTKRRKFVSVMIVDPPHNAYQTDAVQIVFVIVCPTDRRCPWHSTDTGNCCAAAPWLVKAAPSHHRQCWYTSCSVLCLVVEATSTMASVRALLWAVVALCVAGAQCSDAHMGSSFWGHQSDDPFPALVGTCVSNVDDDLSAVEVYVDVPDTHAQCHGGSPHLRRCYKRRLLLVAPDGSLALLNIMLPNKSTATRHSFRDPANRMRATVAYQCCGVEQGAPLGRSSPTPPATYLKYINASSPSVVVEVCTTAVCGSVESGADGAVVAATDGGDATGGAVLLSSTSSLVHQPDFVPVAPRPAARVRTGPETRWKALSRSLKYENSTAPPNRAELVALRDAVAGLLRHSFDSYMEHAYPSDELKPLECVGTNFEPTAGPALTLIDSLDTLALMRDFR